MGYGHSNALLQSLTYGAPKSEEDTQQIRQWSTWHLIPSWQLVMCMSVVIKVYFKFNQVHNNSSVSIFHFLYYKQWRGGTCIWPVIFLLQPVIWSPLSAWWHDVSAVSCTCHNKSVSLQGLTTPKRGTPFGYTSKYGVFEKKFHLCVIIIPWKWIFWSIRIHHTKGQIL